MAMTEEEWRDAPLAVSRSINAVRRRREIVVYQARDWKKPTTTRQEITEFTAPAASRLRRAVDNTWCDWRGFWTLTYGVENMPTNGPEVKGHLRALWERLRRRGYLSEHAIIWWLEFQARGAAHIHAVTTGYIDKSWIADAWAEITGGNPRACSRVEGLRNPDAAGSYAAKYAAKRDQKVAPEWFANVGRWWGYVGRRPEEGDLPSWASARSRGRARTGERVGRPQLVPRRAAPTSQVGLDMALAVVRDAQTRPRRPRIRYYCTDHAVIFYGGEEEISQIWRILCPPSTSHDSIDPR